MSEQPPQPDIAAMTRKSRQRACELLGLDPNSLKPADEILVARVGALRVLVADYEAALLNGQKIDVAEYVRASEALEALVRTDRRMLDGSPAAEEDARRRMREVLRSVCPEIVEASDREDAERERALTAEPEVDESESEPPAEPVSPAPSTTPSPPPSNVQYLSTRRQPDGKPPRHYLREGQQEPWRDNSGGTIAPPFFPIDPCR
jgi:hypothetical protein